MSTTVDASRAVSGLPTPPAREATTRASPPVAGSSQRAVVASSSDCGSGRPEVKSRSPEGVKIAPPSPFAERVRRRAGCCPLGSTSQSAVVYAVLSVESVDTEVTRRVPSWESTRPPTRGRATYWSRSVNGAGWSGAW